jgi:hypothetical protein
MSFPLPCYLIPRGPKYSPEHPWTLWAYIPASVWVTKFHTHTKWQ